jgi:hypothetical protein
MHEEMEEIMKDYGDESIQELGKLSSESPADLTKD